MKREVGDTIWIIGLSNYDTSGGLEGADETIDKITAQINYRGRFYGKACFLDFEDIPKNLQERLSNFHEDNSMAAYLHMTEGKDSYESAVGEKEHRELLELCDYINY